MNAATTKGIHFNPVIRGGCFNKNIIDLKVFYPVELGRVNWYRKVRRLNSECNYVAPLCASTVRSYNISSPCPVSITLLCRMYGQVGYASRRLNQVYRLHEMTCQISLCQSQTPVPPTHQQTWPLVRFDEQCRPPLTTLNQQLANVKITLLVQLSLHHHHPTTDIISKPQCPAIDTRGIMLHRHCPLLKANTVDVLSASCSAPDDIVCLGIKCHSTDWTGPLNWLARPQCG